MSFCSLKPNKIVFIDDLSPEYSIMKQPLNFETAAKVFTKIAKFHALSFYLHGNDNVSFAQYKEGFISDKIGPMIQMLQMMFGALGDIVKGWGGKMEVIGQKYKDLAPHLYDRLVKIFSAPSSGFNVLNHGDFHIKNVIFKRKPGSEEDVEEIRLVSNLLHSS